MVSSKKHWTSKFNNSNNQNFQHGINSSIGFSGKHHDEDEPKVRWYPKLEQLQILKPIFDSGMESPSAAMIKRICAQCRKFGPVGERNIFYWFQNRKYRNKNKQPLHEKRAKTTKRRCAVRYSSSSSSSSTKNTRPNEITVSKNIEYPSNNEVVNFPSTLSETFSLYQNPDTSDFHTTIGTRDLQLPSHPLFSLPMEENNNIINEGISGGYNFYDELSNMIQPLHLQNGDDVLDLGNDLENFMRFENATQMNQNELRNNNQDQEAVMNMIQQQENPQLNVGAISNFNNDYSIDLASIIDADADPFSIPIDADPFPIPQFQGVGVANDGMAKCTVSINNQLYEVDMGPFNVREYFGDGAILLDSHEQIVPTNEWGVTFDSLQHGASYYVVDV